MNNVDLCQKIKDIGNCLKYAQQELGLTETKPGRGNCPWRSGSNSGSIAINKETWYDHRDKTGGSIIDLSAKAEFNGDPKKAIEHLAQYYKIEIEKPKTVATYSYSNLQGEKVYDNAEIGFFKI